MFILRSMKSFLRSMIGEVWLESRKEQPCVIEWALEGSKFPKEVNGFVISFLIACSMYPPWCPQEPQSLYFPTKSVHLLCFLLYLPFPSYSGSKPQYSLRFPFSFFPHFQSLGFFHLHDIIFEVCFTKCLLLFRSSILQALNFVTGLSAEQSLPL